MLEKDLGESIKAVSKEIENAKTRRLLALEDAIKVRKKHAQ